MTESKRRPRLKNFVGTLVLVCFLWIVLRWFEYSQVYHPHRRLDQAGEALGRPWENVFFQTSDGVRLNGWFFPADPNSPRPQWAVLLCHGNAGNISHRFHYFEMLLDLGVNVFAFDYRGYGASEGRPSEEGTYADAVAAHGWLEAKGFAPEKILALGESLGGAIAAELATRVPLGGIVLQSTFTSVPAVGAELFPWLPVRWISTIQYDVPVKLARTTIPVLILHSRDDSLVGFHHAERNFAAANALKFLKELSGDHNESLVQDPDRYRRYLDEFLKLLEEKTRVGKPPMDANQRE
ncbi:MAG: alpha/beta fold hydrolase [Verrucomicrobia bacterium]|nr:alpha/beta fold hydrolase [Verrucomicrobiota bacterium]